MKVVSSTMIAIMGLIMFLVLAQSAGGAEPFESAATLQLRATLKQRFPEVRVDLIRPAPVAGLYEVFTPDEVVYVDGSGDYMFTGRLLATRTRLDLSAASWSEHTRIDFDTLPVEAAIKTVHGTGTRKIAVFSDPDCPYCRNLEKELATLDDVTIYSFLFPLEELHKGATARSRRIWCSKDRAATWRAWMLESAQPAQVECPVDPIQGNLELGARLRVNSTPTVFFADGSRLNGAVPRQQLEKLLGDRVAPPVAGSRPREASR